MSGLMTVAELASEQWGLITTRQAAQLGISAAAMARWADQGALTRLTHGTYKAVGSPYDPRDELRAAWLGLDPKRTVVDRLAEPHIDAVVSHRSAAALHGLGDLDADVHEFTVAGRRQSRRPDVRIHTRSAAIDPATWTRVAGLPVTTVIVTIVDLAAMNIDGGHLAGVVRDAVATAVVDIDELGAALAPYAHRYNAMLGDGRSLVQRLLKEAGLPRTTQEAGALVRSPTGLDEAMKTLVANNNPEFLRSIRSIVDSPAFRDLIDNAMSPETKQRLAASVQAAAANHLRDRQ